MRLDFLNGDKDRNILYAENYLEAAGDTKVCKIVPKRVEKARTSSGDFRSGD